MKKLRLGGEEGQAHLPPKAVILLSVPGSQAWCSQPTPGGPGQAAVTTSRSPMLPWDHVLIAPSFWSHPLWPFTPRNSPSNCTEQSSFSSKPRAGYRQLTVSTGPGVSEKFSRMTQSLSHSSWGSSPENRDAHVCRCHIISVTNLHLLHPGGWVPIPIFHA